LEDEGNKAPAEEGREILVDIRFSMGLGLERTEGERK